ARTSRVALRLGCRRWRRSVVLSSFSFATGRRTLCQRLRLTGSTPCSLLCLELRLLAGLLRFGLGTLFFSYGLLALCLGSRGHLLDHRVSLLRSLTDQPLELRHDHVSEPRTHLLCRRPALEVTELPERGMQLRPAVPLHDGKVVDGALRVARPGRHRNPGQPLELLPDEARGIDERPLHVLHHDPLERIRERQVTETATARKDC